MSLSSILAGFNKGLKDVGEKVATEANLFREAAAETMGSQVAKYNKGEDQGFIGNLGGVVGNIGRVLGKAATGGADVLTGVVTGDGTKISQGATKLSDTISLKPVAALTNEFLGADSKIQKTIAGASGMTDIYGNIIGKVGSAKTEFDVGNTTGGLINLGSAAFSALPYTKILGKIPKIGKYLGAGGVAPIFFGSALGGAAGGSGIQDELATKTSDYTTNRTNELMSKGYTQEKAKREANNEVGGLSLGIQALTTILGMKVGSKFDIANQMASKVAQSGTKVEQGIFKVNPQAVTNLAKQIESKLTTADILKHNTKYGTFAGAIQASEPLIYDLINKSDADEAAKSTARSFIGNTLMSSVFLPKGKGLSAKLAKNPAPEQMRMPDETPTPITRTKGPSEVAMDNVARYEDYVAGIKKSGKMPNGKAPTKKDISFMSSEYKRLIDTRNSIGKTPDTELVDLGGGKGTLVRDKVYALPEPKEAPIAREQAKRAAYLSELEGQRKEAENQAYMSRRAKEFDDYNKNIETQSNVGQAGRNRTAYLAELEKQRSDYANQQELDVANTRLAGEFDQYRNDQVANQKASDEIMSRPATDSYTKFIDTKPTAEQAIIAGNARRAMDEGRSPNTILDNSNLTPIQKSLIIKDYQNDLIQSQKEGLSAKLAKSPETTVLSTPETPVAPVKDVAGENAKGEEASVLSISPDERARYMEQRSLLDSGTDKYGNLDYTKQYKKQAEGMKKYISDIESKLTPSELEQINMDYTNSKSDTSNGFDANKGTEKSDISKSLSDISNSLSLDNVYVSRSKSILNKPGTIGGYVEKGLSKVLNRDINLRNITQSARNSANLFANKILESVGVDKTQSNITRDIKIKPEDVVDGVTPNEGTVIGAYNDVKAVLDDIIPNGIKNFIGKGSVKDNENQARAEYIYEVNKGNKEKLDTLLSPDEQVAIQSRIAARDKASGDLAQHLVDNGFLKDIDVAKAYVRYVLSEAGRDKLKTSQSVVVPINGKDYKFDSIDQALTSMMARRKSGDGRIADSMETAISSIVKEKATGIDTLRVHSPTVQLLSYAMEVGKLLQNKAVLDNFRKFQKGADGLPTAESKFIEGLFPDSGPSEILEQIIGINRRDAGISGRAQDILSGITKATSTGILAGKLGTAIQPFFSSVPKGGLVAIKNIIGGNGVSLGGIKDQKVSEILDANGFTPDYQVFDTSGAGKVEGGLHWLAAESSGRTPELAAKTYTSLSEMRRVLNDNEVKTSSSPVEIATNWEKFARDPKNKDQYLIAQDRIQETLDWMGGSTIFNKSMNDLVRKTNFQALTGYVNGQVNKAMSDIGRVVWFIEAGDKGSGQRVEAAKRLTGTAAVWGLVAAGAYGYMKNQNPDASEESLLDMAIQYANKQAGNPLQGLYAVTSGVTNSPLGAGAGVLKDAITTGYSFLVDSPDKKVQADRLLNNIIKLQGGLSTAETISGGALTKWVASALDTVNTSDITESGNARGVKDYGLSAALLGFKPNTMMQSYLYGKLNKESLKNSLGVKDGFIGNQMVNAASLGKEWVQKVMTPLNDLATSLSPDRTDWGRMQAIHDTYKKITLEDNASSFLGKIGVTDPKLRDLFVSEIASRIKNEKGNITKKSATGNEFAASLTGVGGDQRIVSDKFGKMMADIELSNPYLYNQILAGSTSIAQEVSRRGGDFPADKNTASAIKSLMSTSSSKDDAAIAGITQHNPNSTAFGQALWTTFGDIVGGNPTAKDTQKGLKFLDGIMGEVYKGGQYTTGLERSIALKAFSTLPGIAERIKEYGGKAIGELLTGMPFLSHALQQGLRYRGWVPDGTATTTPKPTRTGTGLSSKLSSVGTAKSTTSTTSIGVAPTDTKKKKVAKIDLKDKYYRAQPGQATKVLSLSDLLSRR